MEIHALIGTFRRRWSTLLVVALVALTAAYGFTRLTPPTYTATARDFVSVQGTDTVGDLFQGSSFARQQTESYATLVNTPLVLDPVIAELGLTTSSSELAERVSGTADGVTTLVNISVTGNSPEETADVANAVARQLDQAVQTVNATQDGIFQARITVVRPATVPTSPTSPNPTYNLAIGLVLGLVLGAGAALGRDLLDGRVRDVADVRRTAAAPLLGSLARTQRLGATLIRRGMRSGRRADDFRRLRTAVQATPRFATPGPHTLAVVSPRTGDGKTTTAVNLSVMLAETGAKVTLVDGNFHAPAVAEALEIPVPADAGWASVLSEEKQRDEVTVLVDGTLSVVPTGAVPTNPAGLLSSPATARSLKSIAATAEWVVIDTPSMLTASDAAILAPLVDGVILVVDVGTTRHRDVSTAMGLLESVGADVIGVVANRA